MEKSERVLKALSDHSQSSDYKYERLYRYLFSEEMFAVAYQASSEARQHDTRN